MRLQIEISKEPCKATSKAMLEMSNIIAEVPIRTPLADIISKELGQEVSAVLLVM